MSPEANKPVTEDLLDQKGGELVEVLDRVAEFADYQGTRLQNLLYDYFEDGPQYKSSLNFLATSMALLEHEIINEEQYAQHIRSKGTYMLRKNSILLHHVVYQVDLQPSVREVIEQIYGCNEVELALRGYKVTIEEPVDSKTPKIRIFKTSMNAALASIGIYEDE